MLKYQQSQVSTHAQVKRVMDDNNKNALIANVKRKIKKLEEENIELIDQLKINYADLYTRI